MQTAKKKSIGDIKQEQVIMKQEVTKIKKK